MAQFPIPPLDELYDCTSSELKTVEYLMQNNVIEDTRRCDHCQGLAHINLDRMTYRCVRCKKEKSVRTNTFFAGSKLSIQKILRFGTLWLYGDSSTQIRAKTHHSWKVVSDFSSHYRQLVCGMIEEEDTKIGGPGVVVEIDETKMGKRKYNRGHRVEGVWVMGGVERTELRKFFAVSVPDRSAATLIPIIQRHILPGSVIMSDLWKAYSGLEQLGYTHQTVNHSINYVDPETGACTNKIEGTWNGLKQKIPARNRVEEGMDGHLLEFIWRRKHVTRLWDALLEALRETVYM